jgi:hypothetical protein
MSVCFGTVVIALARSLVVEGLEYVGSPSQRDISMRYLATPLTQIEVALAYQLVQHILVLKEDLVHSEGVLGRVHAASSLVTFSLKCDSPTQIPEHVLKASTSFRKDWNYPEMADDLTLRHRNLLHCSLLVVGRARVA